MNSTNLFASTEIIGALATRKMTDSQVESFAADPNAMIAATANVDISDIKINVIENSSSDIHLALPYYSEVEIMQAEMIKDERLANIAGGEILISIGVIAGTIIGSALGTGLAASAIGATVGGAIGGIAVAGIAASVAGVEITKDTK